MHRAMRMVQIQLQGCAATHRKLCDHQSFVRPLTRNARNSLIYAPCVADWQSLCIDFDRRAITCTDPLPDRVLARNVSLTNCRPHRPKIR